MKFDAQYWRGFLGGLRWVINHFNIEWDLYRELTKKIRETKSKVK